MNPVQFEPKIASDIQVDWRRPSRQGADPFTDFLKQNFDVDQRARAAKKREEAAEPVSGRPPRVVVSHPKTLRGEAKRVEDADRRLPDQSSQFEGCTKEPEPVTLEDSAAMDADTAEPDAAEVQAEADATAEQPVAAGEAEAVETVTPVVVSVQSTGETDADGEAVMLMLPVLEPAEEGILPAPADQAAGTPSSDTETDSETTAEQQAVAAMAEAGLTEGATALVSAEKAPAGGATPAAVTQPPASPIVETKVEHPLLQRMAEAAAQAAEPVPAPQAKPDRAPLEIKPRANTAARPAPATPATPAANPTAQPTQPQAATTLLPAGGGEFAGSGETFFESLSDGGTDQGWALHLAQGAAGKRPDFIAQLRQHLQNLPAHEQVAVHLQRAVRDGTNKFSIQLSPAELGNIHVKLEIDEEKRVTAAVTVERPSTLELLQRDIKGLERALHNAGLNMEGGDLSFSLGHGDQEFAQDLRHSGASAAGGTVLDGEADGDQPDNPVAQVMDTAAGVVNLQV
jgi:flagellar hook-length control protein FliK